MAGFSGVGAAGINTVRWDGRDDVGANAGSGVYHYRLQTETGSASGKMVMVK